MSDYRVFYKVKEKVTSYALKAESPQEAIENFNRQYPYIKTAFRADRIYLSKKVQDELNFVWSQETSNFIRSLIEGVRFYIEGNNGVSREIEDKYFELTGEVLVPTRGAYNIAPDEKWGVEGSIFFSPMLEIPDSLDVTQEKPGQINSTSLFWTLIRMGFRIDGKHKSEQINKAIPLEFSVQIVSE
jgi:hypothetical protein